MAPRSQNTMLRAIVAAIPVLALGIALSIGLGAVIDARIEVTRERDFEREANEATNAITREIERHARAFDDIDLFAESTWPGDLDEWQQFVSGRLHQDTLPAFSASAGAIERVPPDRVDEVIARETESTGTPFTISPLGPIADNADRLVLTRSEIESVGALSVRGLELTYVATSLGIELPATGDELVVVSLDDAPSPLTSLLGLSSEDVEASPISGTDAIFIRDVTVDDEVVGYVFALIRLGNLLSSAVDETSASINISVRAMEFNNARNVGEYLDGVDVSYGDASYMSERTESIAGLTWQIAVWTDDEFGADIGAVGPVQALGAGLALTLALAGLVAVRRHHRSTLEAAEFETSLQKTLAETDALTGLLNRQGLSSRFAEIGLDQVGASVFFIDVDDFKHVNDQHGHTSGDRVLISIGERLRSAARSGDLIARLGGDEFLAVCPGLIDPDIVDRIADRMTASISEIDQPCEVQVSVGVAIRAPGTGSDLPELLLMADEQMYQAKKSGENAARVWHSDSVV